MQGIKCIQGSNRLTDNNGNRLLKIFFRRQNGLYWFPRNARLDPHPDYGYYHDECLESIKNAFDSRMPAIIDFHRVNIAGRFNKSYRDRSLNELDKTLIAIEKNWADARFISTPELLKLCQT